MKKQSTTSLGTLSVAVTSRNSLLTTLRDVFSFSFCLQYKVDYRKLNCFYFCIKGEEKDKLLHFFQIVTDSLFWLLGGHTQLIQNGKKEKQ